MEYKILLKKNIYIIILLFSSILGLKINANENFIKTIEWEKIKSNNKKDFEKPINWEIINKRKNNKTIYDKKNKIKVQKETKNSNQILLQLGKSVPTAHTLQKGSMRLETSHVSTFKGGLSGGIGNQNYSGMINYGLTEKISISPFYTESDDPLFRRIEDKEIQPENLWINYGIGMKWNIIKNKKISWSIDSSIENWKVGSGGCFGYNCRTISNNIFNDEASKIINNNIIGSISFPTTWSYTKNIDFTLSPRFIFLPKYQKAGLINGKFYDNNYGLGLGVNYRLGKKFKTFYSSYIPINSKNYMNEELKYKQKTINSIGLNYALDQNSSLEGYITNSFGQTPATSVLTMPSSNEIIYGGRYIYSQSRNAKTKNTGYSNLFNQKLIEMKTEIGNKSNYFKLILDLSKAFDFEITNEYISKNLRNKNNLVDKYLLPGTNNIRGGGTANLYSIDDKYNINSSLRLTYGRAMGATRPGYLYGELINEWRPNKSVKINIIPKIVKAGESTPIAIETNLNLKITPKIEIIPSYNKSINKTEDNYSLTVRTNINKNLVVDNSITNALSNNDMGSLFNTEDLNYTVNISYKL